MTIKIVFWNLRGGSGKSTLTQGLAEVLLKRHKSVVIVDRDPMIGNSFQGFRVSRSIDEGVDYNLIDCPPMIDESIFKILKEADGIVIPQNCSCQYSPEETFLKFCDPKKTYIVPTWYRDGDKIINFSRFKVLDRKLPWESPPNQASLKSVCEELADTMFSKT